MASPIPQTPSVAVAVAVAPPTVTTAAGSATQTATTTTSTIIDLDSIPGQIGHAILRASDGTILRPPTGSLTEQDIMIVYRIMLEIGTVLEGGTGGKMKITEDDNDTIKYNINNDDNDEVVIVEEGLQRVTVGFKEVSYAVTLGGSDGCLYIVKKKSSI